MDTRPTYNHAQAHPLKRAIRRSAGWKPLSLFYARTLHLLDKAVFKLSRGRLTFTSWLAGLPVAWLTTTGAKSGAERTSPVLAIPTGSGTLIVIASNYGQRNNPSWYHNLTKNPRTRVLFDGSEQAMVARVLEGEERERWYERGIEIYPGWVQYRQRAPRVIPVIELSRAEAP
jgi:deazaflavin-dependent oxidoreductase (nitroreductase family)